MKKLFLLIPVLALSIMTGAKTINITPTSPYGENDNLRKAVYYATDGDEIVLADGTYFEPKSGGYLVLNKSLTIKAAAGAHPIVQLEAYAQLINAAKVKFQGIKFDGSLQGSYDYFFRAYDVSASCLVFDDCEFYSIKNEVFRAKSDVHMDSLIVNNCYFHDNKKNAVYFEASATSGRQTCDKLYFANSTVAKSDSLKNYTSTIDIRPYGSDDTDAIKVIIDHCTFYDNPTINTDHSAIRPYHLTDVTISNCIFAKGPNQKTARNATSCYGGNIKNCLVYELNYSSGGHRSGPTITNNIVADPLFNDLANNKYTFAGNWVTMSLSPARAAATDGSDLGDPRWYSAETLPSTNLATPYQFTGDKALLMGNIWYDEVNEYLYGDGGHNKVYGTAKWKFHAEKACVAGIAVNLNSGSPSVHKLRVEVLDADGNSLGEFAEEASTLPGTFSIPAAGDYTVILHDDQEWSSAKIDNVTISYIGGDVQNMPGTTDIDDAWFSSNGTRTTGEYISIPAGQQDEGWVKWNVAFASAGNYNVTVTIDNENGHNYTVALYEDEDDESPITLSEGGQKSTIGTIELGAMEVPAGNYIMKVTNAVKWSDAKLISVTFAYAGGGVVEFGKASAGSLLANADAIVSDDWSIEGGKITHAESKALTGWAKWNVDCADYGNYNVTVNISSDNGHLVRVEIFENESESAIYTLDETSSTQWNTGNQAINLGNIVLDDREYVVKVSNTQASSHVQIASIVITYLNGARATLPATCTFSDLMLSEKAHITESNLWFNTIGDSNPVGQWAKWNVKVASAGTFLFTMNVNSSNGQSYKISIFNGETEIDAFESESLGSGDKTVKNYFNLAAGNYTVILENTYSWSQGHIVSLAVTQPSVLTIDEATESNSVIADHERDGNHDIQIIRTITPNMYNTICLPFDVSSSQLQAIFGSDVELLQMASASVSGDELTLEFDAATSINRGTPYLIKTTKTVSNPVFTDVIIKAVAGDATSYDGADFIGTFVKTTIDASEYNLFLGANDMLYFSNNDVTLKGMRAYFRVKDNGSGAPVRRARIVAQNNVVTELELINGEWQDIKSVNGTIKTIEDGQLILIRDGKRYNVMGIRF